jgi:hypothetical protein
MILSYSGTTYDCATEPIAASLAALFQATHSFGVKAWEYANEAITAIAYHRETAATTLREILGEDEEPNTEDAIQYVTQMVTSNSKWQK